MPFFKIYRSFWTCTFFIICLKSKFMLSTMCTIEESLFLEFTSHPVSQHICYTTQKKCLILHFPFTVASCFLCFLFPSQNVTQYTKCWKNSCCLIKKGGINQISNIQSIINVLNYLYLDRSLNICHFGDDLGRREECEHVCLRVHMYLSPYTSTYIYVVGMEDPAISLPASYLATVVTDRMKFLLKKNSGLITNSKNTCWF